MACWVRAGQAYIIPQRQGTASRRMVACLHAGLPENRDRAARVAERRHGEQPAAHLRAGIRGDSVDRRPDVSGAELPLTHQRRAVAGVYPPAAGLQCKPRPEDRLSRGYGDTCPGADVVSVAGAVEPGPARVPRQPRSATAPGDSVDAPGVAPAALGGALRRIGKPACGRGPVGGAGMEGL